MVVMVMVARTPPEHLRDRLAGARRQGVAFECAWPDAIAAAVNPVTSRNERQAWLAALDATRSAWRAGYERREAPRSEQAVLALTALEAAA